MGSLTVPEKRLSVARSAEFDGMHRGIRTTLGVIVLEADLELDSLEEVPLLGLVAVLKQLLNV